MVQATRTERPPEGEGRPAGPTLRRAVGRRALAVAMMAVLATLSAPARALGAPPPIEAFVSILPEKQFVERIGGERVVVGVMVGPGQSPATYEPPASLLARLTRAQVYFRIGVAFEQAWMDRIAALNPRMQVVDLRRGIPLRPMALPPGAQAGPAGEPDPHVWTSPVLARTMAATVRDSLAGIDPANRPMYAANHAALDRELGQLDRDIRRMLGGVSGRAFMVFHPSWGYFADAYGLRQIPVEVGGKEPGARTLALAIAAGRREGVKVVFVQAQFSRRTAETVARALGARVVAVDPLAEDYLGNMREVARRFAEALR